LEKTEIDIFSFIDKYLQHGIQQIFCTDVSKDGALEGPSILLYKKILKRFPNLYFIASGGVSSYKDLEDLQKIGCSAVIVGKAIYEGKIAMKELKRFV
jgi:phosphoribosylformimino-5-aminoimidazole carboxamide ribotide isomerase